VGAILTVRLYMASVATPGGTDVNALKLAGSTIFGLACFIAFIFLVGFLLSGTVFISRKLLPSLIWAGDVALLICLLLLPLSLFRRTRVVTLYSFFITSYIFGIGVWMYGFLVTYQLWGGAGLTIGLVLGLIGVVPLGILAAALHGIWYYVGELFFGLVITYGARAFALFLAKTLEPRPDRISEISPPAPADI
jgi:hypothetical protein